MLNQTQISELENQLKEEEQQLEKNLSLLAEKEDGEYETRPPADLGRDPESEATEEEQELDNQAVVQTLSQRLEEVKAALERIKTETYGTCKNCSGEEIPFERLKANPAAKNCLKCEGV